MRLRYALLLAIVLVTGCAPKVHHHLQHGGSYKTPADCHVAHPDTKHWCVEKSEPTREIQWWSWDDFWEGMIQSGIYAPGR